MSNYFTSRQICMSLQVCVWIRKINTIFVNISAPIMLTFQITNSKGLMICYAYSCTNIHIKGMFISLSPNAKKRPPCQPWVTLFKTILHLQYLFPILTQESLTKGWNSLTFSALSPHFTNKIWSAVWKSSTLAEKHNFWWKYPAE